MRWLLSQTVVKWFKRLGVLGWVRFRILRLAYKIFWVNSPRNGEWDFVLQWLRPIRRFQGIVNVLDVGSTDSLLIYELQHRGYEVTGIDQRPYQEKNEYTRVYDILNPADLSMLYTRCDYIIAVSTIEHIGLGAYGDLRSPSNDSDRYAIAALKDMLEDNGYFIITVPNKHLGTDTGRGYSYQDFEKLIDGLFRIVHFEERSNQICAVLVKR